MVLAKPRGENLNRHIFTVLILAAAICSYAVGMENGAFAFIALGCALESWFWVRALRLGGKSKPSSQRT